MLYVAMTGLNRFTFVIGCLMILGCGKADFTKPSPTTFSFLLSGTSSTVDHLSFSRIRLLVSEFEFEGVRQNAPDFFFEESFQDDLQLEWPAVISSLDFEIPQGSYETVEISFRLSSKGENGILLEGIYNSSLQNRNVLIRVEIEGDLLLELTASADDGSPEISFDRKVTNQANIEFDATALFNAITRDRFESAVSDLGEDDPLVISPESNRDILDIIEGELEQNMRVVFK